MRGVRAAAMWVALAALGASAQTPVPASGGQTAAIAGASAQVAGPLAFEVVSIRENKAVGAMPGAPGFGPTADGYRSDDPMAVPLITAYLPTTAGVSFYTLGQISGLPDWALRERYEIDAKVGEADLAEWQKPASQGPMLRAMLQTMLAERCKLKVHREVKESSVYFLEVAKGGPKFKETEPAATHAGITLPFGGVMGRNPDGIGLYGTTMASLASFLSSIAGAWMQGGGEMQLVDKTGLTGKYDIVLRRPEPGPGAGGGAPGGGSAMMEDRVMSWLGDLGLKVESGKTQVETLVIDHMERPSEN